MFFISTVPQKECARNSMCACLMQTFKLLHKTLIWNLRKFKTLNLVVVMSIKLTFTDYTRELIKKDTYHYKSSHKLKIINNKILKITPAITWIMSCTYTPKSTDKTIVVEAYYFIRWHDTYNHVYAYLSDRDRLSG